MPTGAAVLRPEMTAAITEAVLDELAEQGYSRLSMEAVAKRAGVGKSALYRRWASKQDMALAVIAEFSVAKATFPDTGSLRGDLRIARRADGLADPSPVFADPARPRRRDRPQPQVGRPGRKHDGRSAPRAGARFQRAIERGELHPDVDMELALDLLAGPFIGGSSFAVDVGPGFSMP